MRQVCAASLLATASILVLCSQDFLRVAGTSRYFLRTLPPRCTFTSPGGAKIVRIYGGDVRVGRVINMSLGRQCSFLADYECTEEYPTTHGRVYDYAWYHYSAAPRRTSANRDEVWFARSWEVAVQNGRQPRPIADSQWMRPINYASFFGDAADYPLPPPSFGSFRPTRPIKQLLDNKTQSVLYLSSSCRPHFAVDSDRDDFIRRASRFFDIDSLGACEHNKDWPLRYHHLEFDGDGISHRERWADYSAGINAVLADYKFRVVIINSIIDDYIAEKIAWTLRFGTIPIYLGMPNAHKYDPGLVAGVHPAMVHIADFTSMSKLAQHVRNLTLDTAAARTERARYFEYLDVPQEPNYPQHAAQLEEKWGRSTYAWDEFVCEYTHIGDPSHRAAVQGATRGDWKSYFASLGKDLTVWGVPAHE